MATLYTRAVGEEWGNYRGRVRARSLSSSPFGIMQQVLELGALCFQALHLLPKHALHLLQRLHASMGLRHDTSEFCWRVHQWLASAAGCTVHICNTCYKLTFQFSARKSLTYKVDAPASSKLIMTYICIMCFNTMCGGKPTAKLRTGDVDNTELQMVTLLASSFLMEYSLHHQS